MKTADDFTSARCALQLKCRNCDHQNTPISGRTLKAMFGHRKISSGKFICSKCGNANFLMKAVPEELSVTTISPNMPFGGQYQGLDD